MNNKLNKTIKWSTILIAIFYIFETIRVGFGYKPVSKFDLITANIMVAILCTIILQYNSKK